MNPNPNYNEEASVKAFLAKKMREDPSFVKELKIEVDRMRKAQKDIGWSEDRGLYDKGTGLPLA
jgi:hypothetical protein